ncbi:class I SAM-dependent methyltransferase [Pseudokineococcus sp. 1T1Z-3]|uniref:class I SAM-dependent methyltransferase n=1 Tax=Pseudokineococcus sp. 1T1Z-3 TaxID=3132745 RepID=UPI00403F21D9
MEDASLSTQERWEGFYVGRGERLWSGRPNVRLVDVVGPMTPGRALDLGCGEGGDAVWLASRGWATTAVDVAPTAVARTQAAAAAAGVDVVAEVHDLEHSLPPGPFDLVSAFFLMSPVEWDRGAAVRRAAATLVPGGVLLLVDHGSVPPWSGFSGHEHAGAQQTLDELDLLPGEFETVRLDEPTREVTGPDGQVAEISDVVVLVRRR